MSLSFHEKSRWLLLASLCVVFGVYFLRVAPHTGPHIGPADIGSFIGLLIVLVVLQVIGHTVLALGSLRELGQGGVQRDERDVLIELKSSRLASWLLACGVFCALCVAVLVPGNAAFVHVLLGFWVASQVLALASELYFHRRGV
jgi:hypothetical protein